MRQELSGGGAVAGAQRGLALGKVEHEALVRLVELAVDLAVNPNTVARAYLDLEIEGVIYKRQGAGTFVSGQGVEMSKGERRRVLNELLEKALVEGVNLGLSERELRDAFERTLEKILQARAPEAVGK